MSKSLNLTLKDIGKEVLQSIVYKSERIKCGGVSHHHVICYYYRRVLPPATTLTSSPSTSESERTICPLRTVAPLVSHDKSSYSVFEEWEGRRCARGVRSKGDSSPLDPTMMLGGEEPFDTESLSGPLLGVLRDQGASYLMIISSELLQRHVYQQPLQQDSS
ncbi:hypothetical protein FNV43_RR16794 [Rhamnella rubrinervis]|uniref:Uncharacterized protein n=1 Tax=Rhamnella rubrinervis TaxID=2594499 RepID=A0A8K0GZF7_9ROSA|nr:hypothetical protein FNV43_RR16794 [Rhamnella rubrinervis]